MRTNSIRRAGAVLLTVAAGVSLLLGASRAPGASGYRAPGHTTPGRAAPGQAAGATPGVVGAYQFLAGWIQANSADSRGQGGYTGAYANSGTKLQWKSTEQNIDVYAFFSLLGRESGLAVWTARAVTARTFVVSMWDPAAGRFSLGTLADGVTTNDNPQTEDVNSWSYLALRSPAYAASVSWDVRNLASATGNLHGVSICPRDALTDCEGDSVHASLHTGTTAWYVLAAGHINPLSATTPISAQ